MIPKVFFSVFCQNLHAVLRWLSKCGRLHHAPINSVYQSTKWTPLKLIGNLSMDMYVYLNWLISSFVNDFRALVRTAFVLAKLISFFPRTALDGGPVPALCRKAAVPHFRLY